MEVNESETINGNDTNLPETPQFTKVEIEEVLNEIGDKGKEDIARIILYERWLRKKAETDSEIDPVTNLPKTRVLLRRIDEIEIDLERRKHGDIKEAGNNIRELGGTLIVVDVDNLHKINEELSHQEGDNLLRAVVRSISSVAKRKGDELFMDGMLNEMQQEEEIERTVIRLGEQSDEMVLLLEGTNIEGAKNVMRQAEENIKSEEALAVLRNPDVSKVGYSFSYGAARYGMVRYPTEALDIADRKMQEAKKESKSRGEHAQPFFVDFEKVE